MKCKEIFLLRALNLLLILGYYGNTSPGGAGRAAAVSQRKQGAEVEATTLPFAGAERSTGKAGGYRDGIYEGSA